MKKPFLIFAFFLAFISLPAQQEYHKWYTGNNAAIDFTTGSATPLTNSAMAATDNPASISDSAGNLLFYCDGISVWTRNHTLMPNGSGLLANLSGGHAATAVRQPGNSSLYYLFTMDAFAGANGLRYNIIDMNLNGGLGDIVPGQKNIVLLTPASEQIIPIIHANDRDIWIVTHPWNSSSFNCYLLTCNGLNTTPVVTTIGAVRNGNTNNATGQINVNPTNDRIATANWGTDTWELFNFNNATGTLSNALLFNTNTQPWGIEFSPDGSKLYVAGWTTHYVSQYDLSNYSQAAIASSEVNLGNVDGPGAPYFTGYMQRAPDGKIYIAVYMDPFLAVINNPNTAGSGCNLVDNGFNLGGRTSGAGLPNKTIIRRPSVFVLGNDTALCAPFTQTLSTGNPNTNWSTGVTAAQITVNAPGTYWASFTSPCGDAVSDTIVISTATPLNAFNLGNDTIYCGNFTRVLSTGLASTVWSTGVTAPQITVNGPGTYWARVSNACGSVSDTITLSQNVAPVVNLGNDTALCVGQSLVLDAQNGGSSYQWQDNLASQFYTVTSAGNYAVTVTNFLGCAVSDVIRVDYDSTVPVVNIGADTSFCGSFTHQLNSGSQNTVWSNGSTGSPVTIADAGWYWADVRNGCGTTRDSVFITQLPIPAITLPADAGICPGQTITLTPVTSSANLLWSDGSTGASLNVNATGTYWVQATENGCIGRDTILISADSIPAFSLGPDTFVCGNQYNLALSIPYAQYHWQDNSTDSFYHVTASGVYAVTVTNLCGSSADEVRVDIHADECAVLIPTAFSPNGDGANDVFRGVCRCPVERYSMHVYNRWGEEVFGTEEVNEGWNGVFRSVQQPLSVYVFHLEYFNYCEQKMKKMVGNVTLVR
ncbi:MAG TPA: gliding motility-associated C-terminal domain-containing protein [Chitinophagales bacterium]|nr:gliding motility-associated C-terminal domain-containing protein [Chitinophagales bacterium]